MLKSIIKLCLMAAASLFFYISPPVIAQESSVEKTPSQGEKLNPEPEYTDQETEQIKILIEQAKIFNKTITPKYGKVDLPSAGVTLDVGENFYFLDGSDAKKVLTGLWGNPPNSSLLGMIFAKDSNAYFYDYAVQVSFDRSGYVSDEDAKDINFDKLLKSMQKTARTVNPERIKQGYPSVEILDWATDPQYDAENKRLLWSKLLKFGGEEGNTLNYNMRFLGRRGVLEFNYIASAENLSQVTAAMPEMSKMANFNDGHRYTDFNDTTDKVASYGVAGLIAGGVAAKKFGLLTVILLFLKKGWILIIAAFAFLRRMLRGKDKNVG